MADVLFRKFDHVMRCDPTSRSGFRAEKGVSPETAFGHVLRSVRRTCSLSQDDLGRRASNQPCQANQILDRDCVRIGQAFSGRNLSRGNHRIPHRMAAHSTMYDSRHRRTSVSAFCHGTVAARRTCIAVAVHMLDLAVGVH
jgi:hypothetical protein